MSLLKQHFFLIINTLVGTVLIIGLLRTRSFPISMEHFKEVFIALVFVATIAPILVKTKSANRSWLEFSGDVIISRKPLIERLGKGSVGLFLVFFFVNLSNLSTREPALAVITWVSFIIPFSIMTGYTLCDREITLDLLHRTYRYRLSFLILLKSHEESLDEIAGIRIEDFSQRQNNPTFQIVIQWRQSRRWGTLLSLGGNKDEITVQAAKVATLLNVPVIPSSDY